MSKVNVHQVLEVATTFHDMANQNGGMFVVGAEQASPVPVSDIRYFSPPDRPEFKSLRDIAAQGAGIVPIRSNFNQLAAMPGREFGLLQPGVGIRPAVITPQSYSSGPNGEGGQLHIAFLTGEQDLIDPTDIATGAADPLNGMLLQTAKTLYGPTIAAHGEGGVVMSGEIGHRYGGLRMLSDPSIREASLRGVDVTDELAAQGKGMAVNMTSSGISKGRDVPGAFDIVDKQGNIRRIPYGTITLGPDTTAILIDHALFNQDTRKLLGGMAPEVAATGLAIVAKMTREDPVDAKRAVKSYGEQALGLQ